MPSLSTESLSPTRAACSAMASGMPATQQLQCESRREEPSRISFDSTRMNQQAVHTSISEIPDMQRLASSTKGEFRRNVSQHSIQTNNEMSSSNQLANSNASSTTEEGITLAFKGGPQAVVLDPNSQWKVSGWLSIKPATDKSSNGSKQTATIGACKERRASGYLEKSQPQPTVSSKSNTGTFGDFSAGVERRTRDVSSLDNSFLWRQHTKPSNNPGAAKPVPTMEASMNPINYTQDMSRMDPRLHATNQGHRWQYNNSKTVDLSQHPVRQLSAPLFRQTSQDRQTSHPHHPGLNGTKIMTPPPAPARNISQPTQIYAPARYSTPVLQGSPAVSQVRCAHPAVVSNVPSRCSSPVGEAQVHVSLEVKAIPQSSEASLIQSSRVRDHRPHSRKRSCKEPRRHSSKRRSEDHPPSPQLRQMSQPFTPKPQPVVSQPILSRWHTPPPQQCRPDNAPIQAVRANLICVDSRSNLGSNPPGKAYQAPQQASPKSHLFMRRSQPVPTTGHSADLRTPPNSGYATASHSRVTNSYYPGQSFQSCAMEDFRKAVTPTIVAPPANPSANTFHTSTVYPGQQPKPCPSQATLQRPQQSMYEHSMSGVVCSHSCTYEHRHNRISDSSPMSNRSDLFQTSWIFNPAQKFSSVPHPAMSSNLPISKNLQNLSDVKSEDTVATSLKSCGFVLARDGSSGHSRSVKEANMDRQFKVAQLIPSPSKKSEMKRKSKVSQADSNSSHTSSVRKHRSASQSSKTGPTTSSLDKKFVATKGASEGKRVPAPPIVIPQVKKEFRKVEETDKEKRVSSDDEPDVPPVESQRHCRHQPPSHHRPPLPQDPPQLPLQRANGEGSPVHLGRHWNPCDQDIRHAVFGMGGSPPVILHVHDLSGNNALLHRPCCGNPCGPPRPYGIQSPQAFHPMPPQFFPPWPEMMGMSPMHNHGEMQRPYMAQPMQGYEMPPMESPFIGMAYPPQQLPPRDVAYAAHYNQYEMQPVYGQPNRHPLEMQQNRNPSQAVHQNNVGPSDLQYVAIPEADGVARNETAIDTERSVFDFAKSGCGGQYANSPSHSGQLEEQQSSLAEHDHQGRNGRRETAKFGNLDIQASKSSQQDWTEETMTKWQLDTCPATDTLSGTLSCLEASVVETNITEIWKDTSAVTSEGLNILCEGIGQSPSNDSARGTKKADSIDAFLSKSLQKQQKPFQSGSFSDRSWTEAERRNHVQAYAAVYNVFEESKA